MGKNTTVLVALLRQPHMEKPNEMRSDPFWEFGSFGLTGCHKTNLMHPKRVHELNGARVAFAQGGPAGVKLVYLTPPVVTTPFADRSEISWDCSGASGTSGTSGRPFRYDEAPVIIGPDGHSDVPEIRKIIEDVRRDSWMGRFASKFRTRRVPLPDDCASQMIRVWESRVRRAKPGSFASIYTEALPCNPPKTDHERQRTYDRLLAVATANAA